MTGTNALSTQFATRANEAHRKCLAAGNETLLYAKEAGEALMEAKAALPHGAYTAWIEDNCHFGPRAASEYKRIAENWDAIEPKRHSGAVLGIRAASELLSEPRIPWPAVGKAIVCQVGDATVRIDARENGDGFFATVERPGANGSVDVEFTGRALYRDGIQSMFDDWGVETGSAEWSTEEAWPHSGSYHVYMSDGEFNVPVYDSERGEWTGWEPVSPEVAQFHRDMADRHSDAIRKSQAGQLADAERQIFEGLEMVAPGDPARAMQIIDEWLSKQGDEA